MISLGPTPDAHNLWERMQKHEIAVLRFAKHPDVAFTNNRAERDLRMAKVKQKVSGRAGPRGLDRDRDLLSGIF